MEAEQPDLSELEIMSIIRLPSQEERGMLLGAARGLLKVSTAGRDPSDESQHDSIAKATLH